MNRAALALALVLLQEAKPEPDAAALAARLTPKDPAPFDAVARLVDLAATKRAEVEAAVAKLPEEAAFYKTALMAELKAREALGAKFGAAARVTVGAKDKPPSEILAEILEKTKEPVDATWAFRWGGGTNAVTMKCDDVPFLEALRALCAEARLGMYAQGGAITLYGGGAGQAAAWQYRNFLIVSERIERVRRVEFGAGEKRRLVVQAQLFWDSKGGAVAAGRAEVLEAVDDKGRAVAKAAREEEEDGGEDLADNGSTATWFALALEPPAADAERIARLRGSVPLRVPLETRAFAFGGASETKSDDAFEISTEAGTSVHGQLQVTVRVKPKGPMEAFKKMPLQVRVKVKDGPERLCYVSGGRTAEGAVEYTATRYATGDEQMSSKTMEVESVRVEIHTATAERRLYFEMRDIALK